jgi:hypothetical protein
MPGEISEDARGRSASPAAGQLSLVRAGRRPVGMAERNWAEVAGGLGRLRIAGRDDSASASLAGGWRAWARPSAAAEESGVPGGG